MRHLNLDQLFTLQSVIEHGSFSAAARELNLSQPAVSQQVKELEGRFGVALVERLGKRAFATPAGSELLEHARRLMLESELALTAMRRHKDGSLGLVRVGTSTAVSVYLLPRVLGDLRRTHPGLEVDVDVGTAHAVVPRIAENHLDIGLITLPIPASYTLEVEHIRSDPMMAVVGRSAAADWPEHVTADFLSRQPLIFNAPETQMHRITMDWFAAHGLQPKPVMQLGNSEAIKAFVAAGLGVAILPIERPDDPLLMGRTTIRALDPPLQRKLGIVMRRDKVLTRALTVVRDALLTLRWGGSWG